MAVNFQVEKAGELARGTSDIRELAKALDAASRPMLPQLLAVLSGAGVKLDESLPIHRVMLAGYSGRELGWTVANYYLDGGEIVLNESEYFGSRRMIYCADARLGHLARTTKADQDPPADVVRMFLAEARRLDPVVGGKDQVITIGERGSRWISFPTGPIRTFVTRAARTMGAR